MFQEMAIASQRRQQLSSHLRASPRRGGWNVWLLPGRMGSPHGPGMRTVCSWDVWLLRGGMGTSAPLVLPCTRASSPMGNFQIYTSCITNQYHHLQLHTCTGLSIPEKLQKYKKIQKYKNTGSSIPARAKAEQATEAKAALPVPCLSGQVGQLPCISGQVANWWCKHFWWSWSCQ